MRVRCKSSQLSPEQVAALPAQNGTLVALWRGHYAVDVGRDYDVLSIYWHDGALWVFFANEYSQPRVAPLGLFTIIDGTIPRTWRISSDESAVFLAPADASSLTFADRVDEGEPSAVIIFGRMLAEMTN